MCLAIVLNPNVTIPKINLQAGFDVNDHGAGFGYYKDKNTPVIKKGFKNFDTFYEEFEKEREVNKDKTFLVHFRIRSKGAMDVANCHPFQLKNGMMIHNGTIWGLGNTAQKGNSDTYELAELIRKVQVDRFPALALSLKEVLQGSRIAVLAKNGTVTFMGENGTWQDGVWYSNMYWNGRANALRMQERRTSREPPADGFEEVRRTLEFYEDHPYYRYD